MAPRVLAHPGTRPTEKGRHCGHQKSSASRAPIHPIHPRNIVRREPAPPFVRRVWGACLAARPASWSQDRRRASGAPSLRGVLQRADSPPLEGRFRGYLRDALRWAHFFVTEVHHRIPQCLLRLRDKADAAPLDGQGIELWLKFEAEAMHYGVDPGISREDLAALIESSTVSPERDENRREHVSYFVRWGRRGELATARRYGTAWFRLFACTASSIVCLAFASTDIA